MAKRIAMILMLVCYIPICFPVIYALEFLFHLIDREYEKSTYLNPFKTEFWKMTKEILG